MTRPARVLVLMTAAVLLAGGCGGEARLSKAQYEQQLNTIAKELSNTLNSTFSSPKLQSPGSLKDAADVLKTGQANISDAADRLQELNPPAQVEDIHKRLVKGFRDFAAAFGTFARATAKGDLAAIQRFSQQVSDQSLSAMVEIQRAIDDLKRKGFDLSRG